MKTMRQRQIEWACSNVAMKHLTGIERTPHPWEMWKVKHWWLRNDPLQADELTRDYLINSVKAAWRRLSDFVLLI